MKICIAEDDPLYRMVLESRLREWGYTVVCATDGEEAWRILQQDDAPEMAILDWMMPGLDGNEVCQRIRGRSEGKYIYLLLLTARGQTNDVVEGLEAGADDYLSKPFKPPELKARLTVGKRILALQHELIESREAMRLQATRDGLTSVWNRRAIMEMLTREISRGGRTQRPMAVILVDLDHFKRINDAFGHLAGDAVLVQAAQRLVSAMRPYDMLGRYGGEEFLTLLPDCDMQKALRCAERFRECLAHTPVLHGSDAIAVTGSFGVAVYAGTEPTEAATLLHEADMALYRAKAGGRNRVAHAAAAAVLAP